MKSTWMIALAALSLAGCEGSWEPGPYAGIRDYDMMSARCRYAARHGTAGYFAASGSPKFVAGATASYAIGEAFEQSADFDDCMKMSGWRPVSANVKPAVATGEATTVAPEQPKMVPEWSTFVELAGDHPGHLVSVCGRDEAGNWICRYPVAP